jgi:hypothetical protein
MMREPSADAARARNHWISLRRCFDRGGRIGFLLIRLRLVLSGSCLECVSSEARTSARTCAFMLRRSSTASGASFRAGSPRAITVLVDAVDAWALQGGSKRPLRSRQENWVRFAKKTAAPVLTASALAACVVDRPNVRSVFTQPILRAPPPAVGVSNNAPPVLTASALSASEVALPVRHSHR